MRFCGIYYSAVTDPNTDNHRSCDCLAGLECLLNLIRGLMMGSCFSTESRSPPPGSPTDSMGIKKRRSFKKRGSRNSSVDDSTEEGLHRIPGRMFLNGSSEVASMFTQQGRKGTNQDAMIVWENFGSRSDTIFCGVFDGHGPHGHLVAKRVRDSLPLKLSAHWEVTKKDDDVLKEISQNRADIISSDNTALLGAEEESTVSVDAVKDPDTFQTVKETFLKAFKVIDRELKFYTNINSFCSGTTAVTLVKQGQDLVIGNVGDSRAILATKDEHNALIAVQLTVDLKPNLPAEAERIRKCKGRVFALLDEPDVARVWLPNVDSPGLAMARAFGDFCLKDFGLISVPEISRRCLTEKDEFVVLASDGIWDVLSNQEVVDIVSSSPMRSSTARKVVESAVKAWRSKYPTSKVDDCAVICLFLDSRASSSLSTASITKSNEASTEDHQSGTVEFNKRGVLEEDEEEGEENKEEEALENEEMNSEPNNEWSALVGVARVNTLVTLPRFVPSKEDKRVAADLKKRK